MTRAELTVPITIVAALAENGVIGRDNGLPWRLKSDMVHFRAITMGKPVVMGRKTFLSIGRPLPGRTTIVVSRDHTFAAPGVVVAPGVEAGLTVAKGDALRRGGECIIVAGGADLYAQTMPLAERLHITYVHRAVDGDAHFPSIDRSVWLETAREEHAPGAGDDAAFAFVIYRRAGS